jgi:transcriptional regulator with XRE-family HTH domain
MLQTEVIPTDQFYKIVAEKLRLERKRLNMDQEAFANRLNLSRTTLINIEKGRQRLSLEQAWVAANILNISLLDLLPYTPSTATVYWEKKIDENEIIENQSEKEFLKKFIVEAQSMKTDI